MKHLRKKSIMETGRRAPNKGSKSGKCEAATAKVVEKNERTPMRSHEGWGRALKV